MEKKAINVEFLLKAGPYSHVIEAGGFLFLTGLDPIDLEKGLIVADDIVKAYQNICRGTPKSIDYSLELLANILANELKEFLFPLIEDLSPDERARRCGRLLRSLEARSGKTGLKGGSPLR